MSKKKGTPKKLTKRERKALSGPGPSGGGGHEHQHIHCVACGAHLDDVQFRASPPSAKWIACQHGSRFATCTGCVANAQQLLDEHDRTGKPVDAAPAFH
jgi:hypothetical protein